MIDPHTNGCPQPEVLAAYVDRGLSLSERARVDAHLASCPQCIALVAGVARTVAELSAHAPDAVVGPEASPVVTRRSVAGALAAAAAVIAVLAAPSMMRPWLDRDAGLVSLVESAGEQRSVLGRLTGGFPHAPLGAPSAGGQDGQASGSDRVQLIAGKIRESFGERVTPSQLHALGVSQLLAGRYDDAAQSLLAASREQPANAKYLNDVATVQLERARRGLRPDDLPRALAAADRARYLDPSLKEAWFNRALALSSLSLRDQAREAWTEYLKRDSTSPWAGEAKTRLEELARASPAEAWSNIESRLQGTLDPAAADEAVKTHVTEARNYTENVLLPAWASAVTNGEGALELQRLRTMSDAMVRATGDAFASDVVAAIDGAEARGSAAIAALARAHQTYATSGALFANDAHAQAEPGLRAAYDAMVAAGSPFAIRVALDRATIANLRGQYSASQALTAAAIETSRKRNYIFLRGRSLWIRGLASYFQGQLTEAQALYEDALSEFERSRDEEQIAAANNLLAGLFYYLGHENQAWAHLTPALRGLEITRSPRLRHGFLVMAATLTWQSKNPDAALTIQNGAISNAETWGNQAAIAEALALRARIRAALGQQQTGESDLALARRHMDRSEPVFRSRLEVTVLSTESELLRKTNPIVAAAAASRALALLAGRGDRARVARLELQLARANVELGRTEAAEKALERGLNVFEQERGALSDEAGLSSLDESWGLFETAVQLAIRKNDVERAFAMAERARVRSIAEARSLSTPRTLREVQSALATDEAIVALNQFDDEVAIWVIRKSHTNVVTRRLARADAERLVARQQYEIWQESTSADAGRLLFDELLRPVSIEMAGVTRLVIVPDTTFEDVSFPGLWDASKERFLVEHFALNHAPSVNAFVAARSRRQPTSVSDPLVIGGATEKAGTAAITIASAYRSPSLMVGRDATRSQFFATVPSRQVVHMSVPVALSTTNPLLSRTLLVDDAGNRHSGAITGRDIANNNLSKTELVVVDEVNDHTHRGEGTLSVARAFMAAGVPAVVGTLPGADEYATRDLMIGFHREMSKGVSAEQALHTVQRNAIEQNGRRLGAWSALVIYGSDR